MAKTSVHISKVKVGWSFKFKSDKETLYFLKSNTGKTLTYFKIVNIAAALIKGGEKELLRQEEWKRKKLPLPETAQWDCVELHNLKSTSKNSNMPVRKKVGRPKGSKTKKRKKP